MHIRVNGKALEVETSIHSVNDLLAHLGYQGQTVAVAVNQHFLPRGNYSTQELTEGMDIEIVSPMSGG